MATRIRLQVLKCSLLPPANEVLGKVIFSQASVCPGGWGWVADTHPRQTLPRQTLPKEIATEAGGTHPTGMHSCFFSKLSLFSIVISTPKTSSYATFRVLSRTYEHISVPVSSKFSTTLGPVYNKIGYNEHPAIRKIFCVFFDPMHLLCRQAVLREARPDSSEEIQVLRIVRNSLQRAELCR